MTLINRMRAIVRGESGQDLLEYALLTALIALAAVVAIGAAGTAVVAVFGAIGAQIAAAA
jgi:pilus assembly protein Flp/PilA